MPQQEGSSRMKAVVGGLLAVGVVLTGGLAMAAKAPNGGGYGYGRAYGHRLHCPSYNGISNSRGRAMCHTAPRRGGVKGAEVPPPDRSREDGDGRGGPQQPNGRSQSNGASQGNNARANRAGSNARANSAGSNARANNAGNNGAPPAAQANQPRSEVRAEQRPPADEGTVDSVDDNNADEVHGRRNQNPGGGHGQGPDRRRRP
ncbi:MAG TPA: hypothetical protein VK988_01595 [Acidimicrobiales bacterium]|nr:hypothetical protein [Acidimicrobiales bacterium]